MPDGDDPPEGSVAARVRRLRRRVEKRNAERRARKQAARAKRKRQRRELKTTVGERTQPVRDRAARAKEDARATRSEIGALADELGVPTERARKVAASLRERASPSATAGDSDDGDLLSGLADVIKSDGESNSHTRALDDATAFEARSDDAGLTGSDPVVPPSDEIVGDPPVGGIEDELGKVFDGIEDDVGLKEPVDAGLAFDDTGGDRL